MDQDFEEWKKWFDSHIDENGMIDLSKHPHLLESLDGVLGINSKIIRPEDFVNLGSTVNFDLSPKRP